jgi:hypothetical protein
MSAFGEMGFWRRSGLLSFSNKTQNRSLQGCCSGRASGCVLRKWWSTWRRVRTCSLSLRAWAARMSSTIMSRIFSVPCSWYARYAASAAAAISGICSCSAMASTSSSVRPQRATQSSRVIMPSTGRRVVAPEPKPKRNPDYSNVSTSLRRCGLPKGAQMLSDARN